jgi:hypothetical protein
MESTSKVWKGELKMEETYREINWHATSDAAASVGWTIPKII